MRLTLALVALMITMPVWAAQKPKTGLEKLASILTIKGTCGRLILYSNDKTDHCGGAVLNTSYTDDRTGFYFTTDNGLIITVSGNGDMQVKEDPDTAVQPIDRVIVGGAGTPAEMQAVGSCRIHNPYKGPVPLDCSATTKLGKFEANFTTDGAQPSRKDF